MKNYTMPAAGGADEHVRCEEGRLRGAVLHGYGRPLEPTDPWEGDVTGRAVLVPSPD